MLDALQMDRQLTARTLVEHVTRLCNVLALQDDEFKDLDWLLLGTRVATGVGGVAAVIAGTSIWSLAGGGGGGLIGAAITSNPVGWAVGAAVGAAGIATNMSAKLFTEPADLFICTAVCAFLGLVRDKCMGVSASDRDALYDVATGYVWHIDLIDSDEGVDLVGDPRFALLNEKFCANKKEFSTKDWEALLLPTDSEFFHSSTYFTADPCGIRMRPAPVLQVLVEKALKASGQKQKRAFAPIFDALLRDDRGTVRVSLPTPMAATNRLLTRPLQSCIVTPDAIIVSAFDALRHTVDAQNQISQKWSDYRSALHGWNSDYELDEAVLAIRANDYERFREHTAGFIRSWMDPRRVGKGGFNAMTVLSGTLAIFNIFSRMFSQSPYYNVAIGLVVLAINARMWRRSAFLTDLMSIYKITLKHTQSDVDHADKVDSSWTGQLALVPVVAETALQLRGQSFSDILEGTVEGGEDSTVAQALKWALALSLGQLYAVVIDRHLEAAQLQQWVIDFVAPVDRMLTELCDVSAHSTGEPFRIDCDPDDALQEMRFQKLCRRYLLNIHDGQAIEEYNPFSIASVFQSVQELPWFMSEDHGGGRVGVVKIDDYRTQISGKGVTEVYIRPYEPDFITRHTASHE